MPLALQAKLLHVLEGGSFTKLGSNKELNPDVRVIAATNRSLAPMIADGTFREDLYYRLQVIEIFVPPLRERREEIQPLATTFLQQFASKQGFPVPALSPVLLEALMRYEWPGNVRELENVIQRFVILRDERVLIQELHAPRVSVSVSEYASPARGDAPTPVLGIPIPDASAFKAGSPDQAAGEQESLPDLVRRTTDKVEREVIASTLDAVRWNRRRAARMLGVSYKTLLNKMKTLGLDESANNLQLATDN
jgi:DNA-binding NtrC family response regulator